MHCKRQTIITTRAVNRQCHRESYAHTYVIIKALVFVQSKINNASSLKAQICTTTSRLVLAIMHDDENNYFYTDSKNIIPYLAFQPA